ncbi:MAG: Rieske 2Fe-2S domain-containing protein [Alphaproteobacteria bacterium]
MDMGQKIPNGILEDNCPRQMWWVAAFGEEITEQPFCRWILDTPIVLYRDAENKPVALYDRCPHRWAPLSQGCVKQGHIVCPYHGMEFSSDGKCVAAPTNTHPPKSAHVRSFPTFETGAFVWIWMGDPDMMTEAPVDMGYSTHPEWSFVRGYYHVAANWILIRENVMDLTHIPFLHQNTFRQNDWVTPAESYLDGDMVRYEQDFAPSTLSPLFCAGIGISEDQLVKRKQVGLMPSLAVSFSDWHIHVLGQPTDTRTDFLMRGCHVVTPAKKGQSHYFWGAAFDVPNLSEDVQKSTFKAISQAFQEDRVLLEQLQENVTQDPTGLQYPEITMAGDSAGIKVRQVLVKKLKKEGRSLDRHG